MAELIIVPLNTEIQRPTLEQIAELTGRKFQSKYDGVRVLDLQCIDRSDKRLHFSSVGMSETYGFSAHNFCGSPSIFDYLQEVYGNQDVLAVTDLPIVVLGGTTVGGRCHTSQKKAVVSQYPIPKVSDEFTHEVLTAVTLHETGHMHGLKDHLAKLPNGKYCVMAQSRMIAEDQGRTEATPADYQLRDTQFCHNCEQSIGNSAPR